MDPRRSEAAAIAALVCLIVPFAWMALGALASGPPDGSAGMLVSRNDLGYLAFVTVPMSVGAALLAAGLAPAFFAAPRFLLASLLGAAGGTMWIGFVVGRLDLSAALPWTTAGAAAMAAAAGAAAGRHRAGALVALAFFALSTLGASEQVQARISGEQRLEVVFVRWLPGETPLSGALGALDVDDHLRGELERRRLTGTIRVERAVTLTDATGPRRGPSS